MRPKLIIYHLLPLLFAACSELITSGPTSISMETAEVTSSSAVINVLLSGDQPTDCKMTFAFLEEDINPSDITEEFMYMIVQAEGHPIDLPHKEKMDNLTPYQNYTVLLAWDEGSAKRAKYVEFKTLAAAGGVTLILQNPDVAWKAEDTAGLFSYDNEGNSNKNTALVVSDECIGNNTAPFIASRDIEMPVLGTDRFFIYYPYDAATVLNTNDYAMHSSLSSNQDVSGNAFYWGIADVKPDLAELNLPLSNALGTVEFKINISNYPGSRLKSVSLFDNDYEAPLAGEFALDPDKGTVKGVAGKTESKVMVSSSSDAVQENLKLSILPGDYSALDMRVFVTLEASDGGNIVVPIRYPGKLKVGSGEKVLCNVEKLVPDSEAYPWYEPKESRDFFDKCAYGSQNTWLIERKVSGKSFIDFDVKARGNLLEGIAPKYYGILMPSDKKGGKFLVLSDGTDSYEERPAREIPSDYKITVGCYGQDIADGMFGVVAIYDKDFNILWSYMIWGYDSGDPISAITYPGPGFTIMDRAIGARKGVSRAVADGSLSEGAAYFEWGRKDPFPWYDQVEAWYTKVSPKPGYGIDYAVSHPNEWIVYSADKTWFYSNQRKDLWGAENTTTSNNKSLVGHKTIYDPCPEGWRVCDYSVCDYVNSNKKFAERPATAGEARYKVQIKNTKLHLALPSPYSDASVVAVDMGDGKFDYWPFYGLMWGSSTDWANKSGNATDYAYAYWSNSNNSASNYKAALLIGYYTSSSWTSTTSIQMADMFTVRCQREK